MNRIFRNVLVVCLLLFIACKATAQKFATHAVKRGESLESIAKQYKVTPKNILTYNKEIKAGQALKANTILVIPVSGTVNQEASSTLEKGSTSKVSETKVDQEEPIGFTSHKVRKRETLYGIAKRYKISEEDIKRYNRELYSAQLKKKMVLRIPKYRRVKADTTAAIDENNFETYIVAPKETRWSIAHTYGITVDSMLTLNPGLPKESSYLAEGYQLKMPKLGGNAVEGQQTQLYRSYTVPKGIGIFRVTQEFNVTAKEVMDLNPEIKEMGGLKEGMIIRLPLKQVALEAVTTDNYIFYEVKPKQNEFRLTRKFGMTWKELVQLNPALSAGVKAGMILKLPKDQTGDFEVRNALILDKFNLIDSIQTSNTPRLLFMLPFRLDKLNLDDASAMKTKIRRTKSLQVILGLYSGALIAADSIAELGVSVDLKTIDNQYSAAKTKTALFNQDLSAYSAIVGPLDVPSIKEVAARALIQKVPVILPMRPPEEVHFSNVFSSFSPKKVLQDRILNHIEKQRTDENIIVIADKANEVLRDSILSKFPDAKIVDVIEEEKNIGVDREKVAENLSEDVQNWVIVETDNYRLAASITSILNAFNNAPLDIELSDKKVFVKMFTTNNKAFENDVISNVHLSNLNFTYPSVYREVSSGAFVNRYRKRFGNTPDRYAIRGFDLTYDLLLKLAYKNNLMEVSNSIGETAYTGSKFDYEKNYNSGYYNQSSYIMSFDKMRVKEIKE